MKYFFEKNQHIALAIVRITIGLFMVYHGWEVFDNGLLTDYSKWEQFQNYPNPKLVVLIGKSVELVSGILLTFGFLTRIGAGLLMISMIYITFFVGKGQFWYADQHPFMFVLVGFIYLFIGGGHFSIDNKFGKK